ncbi:MAG: hypothetical protein DRN03_01675 [Thermoplasmata archaeon]|nr:MAG: hypothetical protein DRN03_01675 [Thermoplasmata archaeon]
MSKSVLITKEVGDLLFNIFLYLFLASLIMLLIVSFEPRPYLEQYISMDYLTITLTLILMAYLVVRNLKLGKQGREH